MDNTERWSDIKRKIKWEQFKAKVKDKKDRTVDWCKEHTEEAVTLACITVGGIYKISKELYKRNQIKQERALKDNYIYDRSMGHYWKCRRKPSTNEYLEIERRKNAGESLGSILTSMKLL